MTPAAVRRAHLARAALFREPAINVWSRFEALDDLRDVGDVVEVTPMDPPGSRLVRFGCDQFGAVESEDLAAWIRSTGKRLTSVIVLPGGNTPGLRTVLRAFPEAGVVAAPAVTRLDLEGHELRLFDLGEIAGRRANFVSVRDLDAAFCGDLVNNGVPGLVRWTCSRRCARRGQLASIALPTPGATPPGPRWQRCDATWLSPIQGRQSDARVRATFEKRLVDDAGTSGPTGRDRTGSGTCPCWGHAHPPSGS